MPPKQMKKREHVLRFAESHTFVDEDVVMASYLGDIIIGPTIMGDNGKTSFDKDKQLIFNQQTFPYLAKALVKGKWMYENKPDEGFVMDIREPNHHDRNLTKNAASFGKMNQDSEPCFHLREQWNWKNDTLHQER